MILQQKLFYSKLTAFLAATQICKIILVNEGYMPYFVVKILFISATHPGRAIGRLFPRTSNLVFNFPSRCVNLLPTL